MGLCSTLGEVEKCQDGIFQQAVGQVIDNLGSLNIDRVFHVPHIVRPGDTIAGTGPAVLLPIKFESVELRRRTC